MLVTPRDTARQWLADPDARIIDFETTGWVGYAVEVAVVSMTGETLLNTRLHPGVPIEPSAAAVHGITLDAVVDAPTWAETQERLAAVLTGKNLVAYGAPFDIGVLRRERERTGRVIFTGMHLCAMQLWRQHAGLRSTVKLDTLVATADHSALGDARACLEVVRRVAE